MNKQQVQNSSVLLLTALIWGVALAAQSSAMDHMGPFTFTSVRFAIGGIFLLAVIPLITKFEHSRLAQSKPAGGLLPQHPALPKRPAGIDAIGVPARQASSGNEENPASTVDQANLMTEKRKSRRYLFTGGISCGIVICFATCLQQFGIIYTPVGRAGFITTFYIVIVPILGLFLKRKCGPFVWMGVFLALIGLYFLCIKDGFKVELGDVLILICAFMLSFHILIIDHFVQHVDGVKMSCIQFFVCSFLSGVAMFIFEEPSVAQIAAAAIPLLYTGVLSSGVGYTLQIIGQKGLNPTVASLILSMESVFSVLAGFIFLNQMLTPREILGCVFMFAAIILAQLPDSKTPKLSDAKKVKLPNTV